MMSGLNNLTVLVFPGMCIYSRPTFDVLRYKLAKDQAVIKLRSDMSNEIVNMVLDITNENIKYLIVQVLKLNHSQKLFHRHPLIQ